MQVLINGDIVIKVKTLTLKISTLDEKIVTLQNNTNIKIRYTFNQHGEHIVLWKLLA